MTDAFPTLNALLHQPVRTRLVVILKAQSEVSFSELKSLLGVTDGNLDAHMKKLTGEGYIHTRMVSQGRPKTLYSLSKSGSQAVDSYLQSLKDLLKSV